MNILIIDDDPIKLGRIKEIILDPTLVEVAIIHEAYNIADGISLLSSTQFDLLLLDLNIPLRDGEIPKHNAGVKVLTELRRNNRLIKPSNIIGLTSYEELKRLNISQFEEHGWLLISYDDQDSKWEETILNKIHYIISLNSEKKEKLKDTILFLSASPTDETRLRVDEEYKKIDLGISQSQYRDNLQLINKPASDFTYASQAILDATPQFVHFSGHGNKSGIALENVQGTTKLLSLDAINRLLSLYKDNIKCAIFNACYSSEIARDVSSLGFYTIGMSDSISDPVAIAFSIGFYQAIGAKKDIEFAYKLGLAHIAANSLDEVSTPILWKNRMIINS